VITPRTTRLVRVPDLQTFRRALVALADAVPSDRLSDAAIVVPTQAAARVLRRTMANGSSRGASATPKLLTREQLYDTLHGRLSDPPRRLTAFERDAMMQAAAIPAAAEVGNLPFQLRPGLVAEILRFYDQLRRQSQQVRRFEELISEALGGDTDDRGAVRLIQQTEFLARTFREYERLVVASGACDEHTLRHLLIAETPADGIRHIVVTVSDWIADPAGLFVADFELLARLPGLETLDLVSTVGSLGSGFHERIHNWWPGLEEMEGATLLVSSAPVRPQLARPPIDESDELWTTHRDREEELLAVSRRLRSEARSDEAWNRVAVVFKRPLPYLYIAPDTLGAAGIPYEVFDALPLAAEPMVSAVDLILDAVETRFSRESLVALLGSPHLKATDDGSVLLKTSLGELNHALSDARYLGGLDRLQVLSAHPKDVSTEPAFALVLAVAEELAPLLDRAPASQQLGVVSAFLERHLVPLDADDPFAEREERARSTVTRILTGLADAHRAHHDPLWSVDDLAGALRRWIGDETFFGSANEGGVCLLDDQAARYGEFDDLTIVGLIENEWPERPRRNIFYPPTLLKALNWPSEKDRHAADDARFLDLLASASSRVELSTFTLDDEALVTRSVQLDEVPLARLSTVTTEPGEFMGLPFDILTASPLRLEGVTEAVQPWAELRSTRAGGDAPEFHGATGLRPAQSWSVSALETYIGCPFKFFAQHVLKLEEEPDDEEVMDPRRQGQFVHEVFETFFREWQEAGHGAIVPAALDRARTLFTSVVDRALERLPEGEAALERTRLLGSSAASGLGEAVFRMEAERPVPVVERLLEHSLKGAFTIETADGPRVVELRGKADRVDLLADGTFRLIDYKLGWPPDRGRALQLPIYSVCAEQRLDGHRGQHWTAGEAVYLAFKGPKRVVPLFSNVDGRVEVLAKAQQRLAETIDAIARGEFPPQPDDVFRCDTCSFGAVCRKDYVGDI
jgi:RecB family exonuclease